MNASMNDTHNLGNELKMFETSCTLTEVCSMETHPGVKEPSEHFLIENSKSPFAKLRVFNRSC